MGCWVMLCCFFNVVWVGLFELGFGGLNSLGGGLDCLELLFVIGKFGVYLVSHLIVFIGVVVCCFRLMFNALSCSLGGLVCLLLFCFRVVCFSYGLVLMFILCVYCCWCLML